MKAIPRIRRAGIERGADLPLIYAIKAVVLLRTKPR